MNEKNRTIVRDFLKPNSYSDRKRYGVWVDNDYKGQGDTEVEALTASLEYVTDRYKLINDKYYDLIKKLNSIGLPEILEWECNCENED